jgi:hypothetical protein
LLVGKIDACDTTMTDSDLEQRQSLSDENYTPWWQLLTVFGLAMAICTGLCLLM